MKMSKTVGLLHFIGIGGIGMSGIAEVLHNLGYQVQGSDVSDGPNVKRLREQGIVVHTGHAGSHLGTAEVVVVSAAIKDNNPELIEARERLLPVVQRAEMLAELMRFRQAISIGGTHGKTTTTSMVGALLEAAELDPTIINGGIINALGTNARMGEGEWMVVEADESDGSFLKLPTDIAIITSIDPEHLDHYGDFNTLRKAFEQFVGNVPFYGFGVLCIDDSEVQALASRICDRRIVTYGCNPQADVRYVNVRTQGTMSIFDVQIRDRKNEMVETIFDLSLPMPGEHNIANATAAISVAHELGIDAQTIVRGLHSFSGVNRRFTHVGSWNGVDIFDDYAHHPVEIIATLSAAQQTARGDVIAIMQPHRYSRLHHLFSEFCACFNQADRVIITPVYEAGEQPLEGIHAEALLSGLKAGGHRDVRMIVEASEIAPLIEQIAKPGDLVIFLGAGGSITQWAHALPEQLSKQGGKCFHD